MDFIIGLAIGILLIVFLIPVLQIISEIIMTLGEWIKSSISVKIVKNNAEIALVEQSLQEENTQAIGFDMGLNASDIEDDEYIEEKMNNKIGF